MRASRRLVRGVGTAVVALVLLPACRSEPPAIPITTALEQGEPIDWPLPLGPLQAARQKCRTDFCLAGDALALVLNRAAHWMASHDEGLRFDAAVGLSQVRQIVDSPELERAWTAAATAADTDVAHPHRRFWLPDFHSPPEQTSQWSPPTDGGRVEPNRVLNEALHCRENGWRAQTTEYACGAMRDGGGFQSTHALWALTIARDHGCLDQIALNCLPGLQDELAHAQPEVLQLHTTLNVDLYAERLLMLLLSGYEKPAEHDWARTLIALQDGEGSWGVPAEEDPYLRYQATNTSTWALAEWLRFLTARPGDAAPLGAFRVQAPFPIGGPAFWGCALPGDRS